MWSLVKKLLALLFEFGISLEDIVEIVKELMALPKPPSVGDEAEFRKWVCTVLHTMVGIAERTPTTLDDTVLKMIDDAVENDDIWPLFYTLMKTVFVRDSNLRRKTQTFYGSTIPASFSELKLAEQIASSYERETVVPSVKVGEMPPITDPNAIVTIAADIYELYGLKASEPPKPVAPSVGQSGELRAVKPPAQQVAESQTEAKLPEDEDL